MTIRDKMPPNANDEYRRLKRKANQEWDMAGLARQDRDTAAEKRHTKNARELEQRAVEALA